MAWERGKRKRREGSESVEGLGNAAVKVLVERRRMVKRAQDEEMALAITHLQCFRIRVFRDRVLPVQEQSDSHPFY